MKIIHVLTRLLRAGSEENTLASCRAQARAGHEVYLVHGREYDDRYYQTELEGIRLVKIDSLVHPIVPFADIRAFRELRALFLQLQPDVVHTHQSKAGIIGRFSAHAAKVPLIIHGVHIVPFDNVKALQRLVYLCAEKAAATVTDAFIDVSRGVRDLYVEAGIGRPEQHYVIHSGFDLGRFQDATPPDDWRELLGIGPADAKPPTIVMLAALEPRKRHCEFLEAYRAVVDRHPDVRLLMPGEGPHRSAVEDKIRLLGLERNAKLLGYRTDPNRLIALADICALTSCREGLPRVIMQYLAAGRTCVVSDLPGLDEVVTHGVNGVVVSADDVPQAASAIADLFDSPDELARLMAGAKETDLSSWEVEAMCQSIARVYSSHLPTARAK